VNELRGGVGGCSAPSSRLWRSRHTARSARSASPVTDRAIVVRRRAEPLARGSWVAEVDECVEGVPETIASALTGTQRPPPTPTRGGEDDSDTDLVGRGGSLRSTEGGLVRDIRTLRRPAGWTAPGALHSSGGLWR